MCFYKACNYSLYIIAFSIFGTIKICSMIDITLDKLITIADVHFEFIGTLNKKVKWAIKVGKYSFPVYLDAGAVSDLEIVKQHLELIVLQYPKYGVLEFLSVFDRSIKISMSNIPVGNNDFVTSITVSKDSLEEPIISFYCRLEQAVCSFYLSLLNLIQLEPDYDSELEYYDGRGYWPDYAVPLYNRLQSFVIEDFICGELNKKLENSPRSRFVSNRDEMCADYAYITKKLIQYQEVDSDFVTTAREFLSIAYSINYERTNDLSKLLNPLKHIRLKDGYKLKYYSVGEDIDFIYSDDPDAWYGNFNSYVSVQDSVTGKYIYTNVSQFFEFEFTPQAIWELYLLLKYTVALLPCGWHGGYEDHKLILGNEELIKIKPEKCSGQSWIREMLLSYNDNPIITPSLQILGSSTAKLNVTLFTEWGGLEQHILIIERDNDKLKFLELGMTILKYYHCGIFY